ncbi:hypothetical protein, conserved [Babesia bigemina]|uniref:C3H1-type domain-containing protein n=1 Tax=Babesia bigemina TaxID=5866 RepID=A0A061BIT9_BABBI|nr:hypothetical protein, conserved [Babesia bigemina]CDR71422.1 hypothetical protein, conserved [Babesia bigemina]|eukprot:XP_012770372.1 hypothetical protein, conserved [Babesia bigemina]
MIVQLGELAGKLGGFVGESESVKKAVIYAIIALINSNEELKNDLKDVYSSLVTKLSESVKPVDQADDTVKISELKQRVKKEITEINQQLNKQIKLSNNSPSSPSPSAESAKLQSKLEALEKVEKLCGFHENLKNASNNPKKLLDNLCSGLETFLGFNSESKGYDGSGIVYSDLDRLCDGVMGFLSGVLGAVKNTQTYNVGKNTLNSVSDEINKHLCSGHDGFNKLLPILTKEIERYNREVRESNDKVKKPINELIKYVKDRGEFLVGVNKIQVEKITEHNEVENAEKMIDESLKECQQKAAEFNENYNLEKQTDMKNAISYLNSTLSERVHVALRAVSHETERLQALSGKERKDLDGLQAKISTTLNDLKCNVNERIKIKVAELVRVLKEAVKKILMELQSISRVLGNYVHNMGTWMSEADKTLDKALNKVDEIIKKVDLNDGAEYPRQMQTEIEQILLQANVLFETAGAAGEKVTELVTAAKDKVKKLEEGLMQDLYGLRDAIRLKVNKIQDEIGKLHAVVEQGESTKVTHKTIAKVIEHIQNQIADIEGRSGLQGIVEGVKSFAAKFKEDGDATLGGIVKQWIVQILGREPVKGCIDKYIDDNKGKFEDHGINHAGHTGIDSKFKNRIAELIIAKLKESGNDIINAAAKAVKNDFDQIGDGESVAVSIQGYIGAIKKSCDTFAAELGDKIKHLRFYVRNIVNAIGSDTKLFSAREKGTHVKSNLDAAVSITLQQLVATAVEAGEAIRAFADDEGTAMQRCLNESFVTADDLNKKLQIALGQGSTSGGINYAGKVDKAITDVSTEINTQLPDDQDPANIRGDPRISLEKFTLSFAKPNTSGGGRGGSKSKKELLDDAIEKIQNDVNDTLQGANHPHAEIISHASALTRYLNYLCTAVRDAAKAENPEGLKKKLLELKDFINNDGAMINGKKHKGLNKLHGELKELRDRVDKNPIAWAKSFEEYAGRICEQYVKPMHQHVEDQVTDAVSKITTEARRNYISSIQSLLQCFASKVHSELETLPKSIEDDLTLGFKGFMVKFEKSFITNEKSIKGIKDIETTSPQKESPLRQAATKFFGSVNRFLHGLETQPDFKTDYEKIKPTREALAKLFGGLVTSEYFDHEFSRNLSALRVTLSELKPATYGESKCPLLLNTLKDGFTTLVSELNNAYISAYDSETFNGELVKNLQHVSSTSDVNMIYDLTDEGTRLSKVFLTVLRTLDVSLHTLKSNCKSLPKKRINRDTDIGDLLAEQGYKVSDNGEQNGELQDKSEMTGERILGRLIGPSEKVYSSHDDAREKGPLNTLSSYLKLYYDVCHQALRPKSRLPCNVNEMLVWFTGLPHHPVYEELIQNGLSAPFENPSKQTVVDDDGLELTLTDTRVESITAHPSNITYNSVSKALQHLCTKSYDLLTTVMGHGNAETVYAVDFHTNTFNLKYPTSGEECLQTILDILRRMLPSLRYLYYQCSLGTNHGGWAQCLYGRDIKTSKWPCKNHSTDEPKCQPNDKVTCQPNCQPTSPLMSYLGDCLIGHLPHKLTSIGCRSVCSTCPSVAKLGMPCVTPLGFRAFSGSTKTGRDIYEILRLLFGSGLVSSLLCLVPSPPSTLPEHFQFALALGNMLHKGKSSSANGVSAAFRTSIENASIRLYENPMELTDALGEAYGNTQADHSHTSGEPKHAPLSSLSMKESCMLPKTDNIFCGPYLQSLYHDSYYSLAEKHCNLYLSWAIYFPWQFWNYLKTLYDSFCSISCQDWGCSGCLRGDKCKTGKHGTDYNCRCWSVVKCRGVQSTFYSYGFTFGDAKKLLDDNELRYCHDFCKQLENILNSQFLKDLLQKCDEFIFTIRQPFIWLNVALWSLSLFYLICVMVGRLDVLHIKSHLRSPSSHRITAQSLLAAAQVGRLAKISYLQP